MKLGIVIDDIWDFFHDVYSDLEQHHQTNLFQQRVFEFPLFHRRINRYLLQYDLRTFMDENDVIFFEWASELLAKASHMEKKCGIVTRLHRYDMYKWIDEVNWDAVDKIILVSNAKQREFSKLLPKQAHKIVVIPEAVSLKKFQIKSKKFKGNLGILCHLKPRKRVYDLILTFYELNQRFNGLHLYIGGDKRPLFLDYYEALHTLVEKLNLQDQVTFDGHVTNPEEWYRKIDIFISNSYSEGLQVSPMEAMASGCYCISHHWDGADELLPKENLYYSSSEMIERILSYCEIPEAAKHKKITDLRKRVCDNFDVDKTKIQIRQVIESAAKS